MRSLKKLISLLLAVVLLLTLSTVALATIATYPGTGGNTQVKISETLRIDALYIGDWVYDRFNDVSFTITNLDSAHYSFQKYVVTYKNYGKTINKAGVIGDYYTDTGSATNTAVISGQNYRFYTDNTNLYYFNGYCQATVTVYYFKIPTDGSNPVILTTSCTVKHNTPVY